MNYSNFFPCLTLNFKGGKCDFCVFNLLFITFLKISTKMRGELYKSDKRIYYNINS